MKFYLRTLGCKMNQLDSARLAAALQGAGHVQTDREDEAEWVLVNSCTVTAQSDRKSRQAANSAARTRKKVAVLGCGPRVHGGSWRNQPPDTKIFESEAGLLSNFGIDTESLPFPVTSRTRLPVAIQHGCDDTCTFCITRLARGSHRSEPLQRIFEHVHAATELGIKEIVLTGINLAAWGCEHSQRPEQSRLHELLFELLEQTAMPRIRLSSLGPQYLGPGFFEAFSDERICDHLHLSVQSGSAAVLKRMERGHGGDEVLSVAHAARCTRSDVALTADFIVGFPGEDETDFQDTLGLAQEVGFAKLHVFPFSAREGTAAAEMADQLPGDEKKRRSMELRRLAAGLREVFLGSQLGKSKQVLVEDGESGLTSNYIRLRTPGGSDGELRTVPVLRRSIKERW